MANKVRGDILNVQLIKELDKMILEGYHVSPITRSAMVKRLGIKSRSTLMLDSRSVLITNAAILQLNNAGLDLNGKKKRNTVLEQNAKLKETIEQLKIERDGLVETLILLIQRCQSKGVNIEELLLPTRKDIEK